MIGLDPYNSDKLSTDIPSVWGNAFRENITNSNPWQTHANAWTTTATIGRIMNKTGISMHFKTMIK